MLDTMPTPALPPLDLQPTLTGALVTLRPLRPDDHDALFAVARDPLIWAQHPAHDRWQPDVFRAFFDEALATRGAFAVHDTADGRLIGSSRYFGLNAERREVEIGWTFLARSHWGGRHNGEMKRLMLAHAFTAVERVVFFIGAGNIRSQRAIERIGGVRIAHPDIPPDVPRVAYAIAATAFAAQRHD
jgi:RimJ/RimL family protein N-acetyltransferase